MTPRVLRAATVALVVLGTVLSLAWATVARQPRADPDASRWATVRALVETQAYTIAFILNSDGEPRLSWRFPEVASVDVMVDPDSGFGYSSKPPLLPWVAAWITRAQLAVTHADLETARQSYVRTLAWVFGSLPFALLLIAFAALLQRLDVPPRERLLLLFAAATCTFLTSFSSTFGNHLVGAATATLALWLFVVLWQREHPAVTGYMLLGLVLGVGFTQELPIAALAGALFLTLAFRKRTARVLVFGLPAFALPVLPALGLSYIAFGDPIFHLRIDSAWFRYPGSYWLTPMHVDAGGFGPFEYAFHFVLGHHGVLSLTPLLLLAAWRMVFGLPASVARRAGLVAAAASLVLLPAVWGALGTDRLTPWCMAVVFVAPLVALMRTPREHALPEVLLRIAISCSLSVLTFYLHLTSNFGGGTSGPRWLLWLFPLWLVVAAPAVSQLIAWRRPLGWVVLVLLAALSMWSVYAVGLNPYTHPWLYTPTK